MNAFQLPDGRAVARLGQGTWRMGERRAQRAAEVAALRAGLDLGLTLIDTAEMYADGGAEEVVADAIDGRRAGVYVVSKVLPGNATRRGTVAACERSLRRLRTDYLDLYLLHWRQGEPLEETLEAFETLRKNGSIRAYGVSNFDVEDLEECIGLEGGARIATNQVLYNLESRGIEWDLLPWCAEHGIPVMAYSPLGSTGGARGLLKSAPLRAVAERHSATPAQIALAWTLMQPDVYVIPKASDASHVRENCAALDVELDAEDLQELDRGFPPPRRRTELEML